MNPEDIGRILDEIGERIGPAGEYAWRIAVAHESLSSWIALLVPLSAFVIALVVLVVGIRLVSVGGWGEETPTAGALTVMIGGFASLFTGIALLSVVGTELPDALIPEWGVLRQLVP